MALALVCGVQTINSSAIKQWRVYSPWWNNITFTVLRENRSAGLSRIWVWDLLGSAAVPEHKLVSLMSHCCWYHSRSWLIVRPFTRLHIILSVWHGWNSDLFHSIRLQFNPGLHIVPTSILQHGRHRSNLQDFIRIF